MIVCDEPVSALDVSIQAQVINLLADLQKDFGLTYLFIAHDLAVVRHVSSRVAVMYLGKIAEIGDADMLYDAPAHPYTNALLQSRPHVGMTGDIPAIPGSVADLMRPPSGCRFHPRCPNRTAVCSERQPDLVQMVPGQRAACS